MTTDATPPTGRQPRSSSAEAAGQAPQPFERVVPSLSLPKGGGAIRGIGEKFAANPVTGTGSMSVPIATSPGRSGFGPQLSLSYDSGAGNGPFGFGWALSLPQITRKTDKGLPRYHDAEESDVFILSGAEDLVPVLVEQNGKWIPETLPDRVIGTDTYTVHRYRPRIEGLFARIERWTRDADGDVHWRSISKDNILTLYGKDSNSRITDPVDPLRVFTWLICETRDDKGNAVLYTYKPEDGTGVDLARAHERNRGDRNDPRRATNRYLKRIRYGNRVSLLDNAGHRPRLLTAAQIQNVGWMFEVVFDYGEHDANAPKPDDAGSWTYRGDPFSSYRAGFEVRTGRLCERVLMFHHFADEPGVGADCLVRSTDFSYSHQQDPANARNPVYTFLLAVTQSGYRRDNGGYQQRSLPPVEFQYTQPVVQDTVQDVDSASLEDLPIGLDGAGYQWTDLHGEGIPGILTEQAGAWFYKRNLSPISKRPVEFAPLERVAAKPNLALAGGQAQFIDLAGDGQPDLAVLDGPLPGLYEHDDDEGWQPFRPITSRLNRDMRDPSLKFVDLDGDGHTDVLISEDDAFVWHASLGEEGFGPARRVGQALNEEKGPRLAFADGTQSIYLADLSGDGLTDLVRVRNGEICYWPNLGYGRFGAKVTMDHAPHLDNPDQFDHQRIRLADIDGTGTTDIIYLHRGGVRLYFNQSGNSWSEPQHLNVFPHVDDLVSIVPTDLLGNGTACLVWSSPLPGDALRPMLYVDLMGGQKPHLLVKAINNLGAETQVVYAPSTKFYLADRRAGRPWNTRLPFPVHVVERVVTLDRISGNRFVSRSAYHHGYFDGVEREFRGFGMVEQWDTEEYAALEADQQLAPATNVDVASHVPPVVTRTWFHTGVSIDGGGVSNYFAGLLGGDDRGEYFREPGLDDDGAMRLLLDDTVLPPGLAAGEIRDACRALKGSMLRQEVYALDGSNNEPYPYSVTEQNFTVELLQSQGGNPYAVFFTHPRESIVYHYERHPADPRVAHSLTLEVDAFGNVLTSAAIVYGRRQADATLDAADQHKQRELHVTRSENAVTNAIDDPDAYRAPLPSESRAFELTGLSLSTGRVRFAFDELLDAGANAATIPYEAHATDGVLQKRPIEHVRMLYRADDLSGLLPLGQLQSLAVPFESYKLAFTPGLLSAVFGTKVADAMLADADNGAYVHSEGDDQWWIPSGRVFFSTDANDDAPAELAAAREQFFLPRRYRDPYGHTTVVSYDPYDLLTKETRDAVGNTVSGVNNYRVLQPALVTDPNGNRAAASYDALGMIAGTAVMGKPDPAPREGDVLVGFEPDLAQDVIAAHLADPFADPHAILGRATTRLVYDLFAYARTQADPRPEASVVYSLVRETHDADLHGGVQTKLQHGFSYSDGFGRVIQRKAQAEPGPTIDGGPTVERRWVSSGWTIFNNKGRPVRQFEPFFTTTHAFEFDIRAGVSPIIFYDPAGRAVGTLHPNRSWEKVVFDPWRQERWDVNDTALIADPRADPDLGGFFRRLNEGAFLPTWYAERQSAGADPLEQDAAAKTALHAATPTVAHADSLGRTFLTIAHNRFVSRGTTVDETYPTRVEFDSEGNQRAVIDAMGRRVMQYDYDMLGTQIHQASMEAGERWILNTVVGGPMYSWDSRGHAFRRTYDPLRRPLDSYASEGTGPELLVERLAYGESQPDAESHNLRGKVFQQFDQAGVITTGDYDFKGNLLSSTRQFAAGYKETLHWLAHPPLEPPRFSGRTTFDALNRPTSMTHPDGSAYRPTFNAANLLDAVDVTLAGEQTATRFVNNVDYDAKGQRRRIEYGNGSATAYAYDPLTFRLRRLTTTRTSDQARLQDLFYAYDPAGNITHISDDAQQTIYFNNQVITADNDFTYDAVYRLIHATGREHIGQAAQPQTSWDDRFRVHLPAPTDGQAMRAYAERYDYDAAGNSLQLVHEAVKGNWTRSYAYGEASLIDPAFTSNRLSATIVGASSSKLYAYDAHGNMTSMPHLTVMQWDYRDQLRATSTQAVTSGTPETTYYVYDAAGRRVRKITERQNGSRARERLYLGGFERYREYDATGAGVELQRDTVHVMDDSRRVALIEARSDGPVEKRTRYQLANHLGSSALEVDDAAQLISYEEYFPFGSTSYQAGPNTAEVSLKQYRYEGMERDRETGLNYHGARYYATWLGRWTSCDPSGLKDGLNAYRFCRDNPMVLVDLTGRDSDPAPESGEIKWEDSHWTFTSASGDIWNYVTIIEEKPVTELESEWETEETRFDAYSFWLHTRERVVHHGLRAVTKMRPVVTFEGWLPPFDAETISVTGTAPKEERSWSSRVVGWAKTALDWGLGPKKLVLAYRLYQVGSDVLDNGVVDAGKNLAINTLQDKALDTVVGIAKKAVTHHGGGGTHSSGSSTHGGGHVPAKPHIHVPKKLTTAEKDVLRTEARAIATRVTGKRLPAGSNVHHRIPLEFAHMQPHLDPNRLENLIVVTDRLGNTVTPPQNFHNRVHDLWQAHLKGLKDPSAAELESIASDIDRELTSTKDWTIQRLK